MQVKNMEIFNIINIYVYEKKNGRWFLYIEEVQSQQPGNLRDFSGKELDLMVCFGNGERIEAAWKEWLDRR